MIDIPPELLEENFPKLFIRGAIFLCKNYDLWDVAPKDKYILILNGCDSDGWTYFYLPTSKVDKYRNNPIYSKSFYVIPAGTVNCFDKETSIITRNVHQKKYDRFKRKFVNPTDTDCLTFLQMMPEKVMDDIYQKIVASIEIPFLKKKKILPPEFFASD
jgi:hypothetical protein